MIEVRLSTVEEICLAGQALFAAHVQELEPERFHDLDPDWDGYKAHDDLGNLIVLGAWDGKNLVGYMVALIYQSLHYREQIHCQADVLFVDARSRRQSIGLRLMNAMRKEAHALGATYFRIHAKPNSQLEAMLRLLNFQVEETLFTENLASWAQQQQLA